MLASRLDRHETGADLAFDQQLLDDARPDQAQGARLYGADC